MWAVAYLTAVADVDADAMTAHRPDVHALPPTLRALHAHIGDPRKGASIGNVYYRPLSDCHVRPCGSIAVAWQGPTEWLLDASTGTMRCVTGGGSTEDVRRNFSLPADEFFADTVSAALHARAQADLRAREKLVAGRHCPPPLLFAMDDDGGDETQV